ncbi:MAG: hypothetical protein QXL88_00905 [Candidatus Pacearchaeota archaeon]
MKKQGAFELSVTTMVIIVIAVILLILGLVFVRQIFGVATKSVDTIDDQLQNELMNLFEQEGKDIVVKLGSQQTAKIRQGTQGFGFAFGIAPDNVNNLNTCKYSITNVGGTCNNPMSWFVYGTTNLPFTEISATAAFDIIKVNIPTDQNPCDHKFKLTATCGNWQRSTFFTIQVIKKGFF